MRWPSARAVSSSLSSSTRPAEPNGAQIMPQVYPSARVGDPREKISPAHPAIGLSTPCTSPPTLPLSKMPETETSRPSDPKVKKPKVTMMDQFRAAKEEAGDALLFFRMGDFYELFGEDAEVASKELGIALTSRAKGAEAMAMAGVPVKSMEPYLMRLVRAGHKVAVCEQTSDPRASKGIVDRAIVRVVTAGTITEEDELDSRASNYLAALFVDEETPAATSPGSGSSGLGSSKQGRSGLGWIDLSTGRAYAMEVNTSEISNELARIGPCLLYTSPSPRDQRGSRMPSSA